MVLPTSENQKLRFYKRWLELTRLLAALSVELYRYPAKELSKIFYVAISLQNITKASGPIGVCQIPTHRTVVFFESVVKQIILCRHVAPKDHQGIGSHWVMSDPDTSHGSVFRIGG